MACASWLVAWHTQKWREESYVGEQLLAGWALRGSSCHGCAGPSRHGKLPRGSVPDEEPELEPEPPLEDCSVVVVRIRQWPHCGGATRIAERYRAAGLRHLFLLFGEENEQSCATCPSFYATAPLVARHYAEPTCDGVQSVLTVPMGVVAGTSMLGTGAAEAPASQRRLAWSFVSGVNSPARTTLAAFLQRSEQASAMAHTLFYPWAPRPGTRRAAALAPLLTADSPPHRRPGPG